MVLSASPASPSETARGEPMLEARSAGGEAGGVVFRKLVNAHLDFVWRSLRRFGVPDADADDATQRVFMVASEKLSLIRAGSERAFLVGVASRVASHSRRSHQRREAAEQSFSTNPRQSNPDPEELAEKLEARKLLDRVLDGLTDELRAVFVLFELEELSIDHIAGLLNLPRGTVASRLRRAREVFHVQARLVGGTGAVRKGAP